MYICNIQYRTEFSRNSTLFYVYKHGINNAMPRPRMREQPLSFNDSIAQRRNKLLKFIPDELLPPIHLLGEWDTLFLSDFAALHADHLPTLLKMELAETEETLMGEVISLTRSGRLVAGANLQWSSGEMLQISRSLLYRAAVQQAQKLGKAAQAERVKPFTAKVWSKKATLYLHLKYPSPSTVSLARTVESTRGLLEADSAKLVIYHGKPKNLGGLERKFEGLVEAAALEPLEPQRRRKNKS